MTIESGPVLDLLMEKVYREGKYDFREYKRGTITRRLESRLHATGSKTCLDYMQFLDSHPEEYHQLAECLTIKVSEFFRSPYTFEQVTRRVVPELIAHKIKRGGNSLSLWSAACACGEEPYSLAILIANHLGKQQPVFGISIYATDISWRALEKACAGIYARGDVGDLPATIRQNYFIPQLEYYRVRDSIRQMVSFSYFDLTSTTEPPFVNVDCIFCRNVLIYLQSKLQERVLNTLYDSLSTPGYLVLGEVENLTSSLRKKLECLDIEAKIYKKV